MKHYISLLVSIMLSFAPAFASISLIDESEYSMNSTLNKLYGTVDYKSVEAEKQDWSFKQFAFTEDYLYAERDMQEIVEEVVPSKYVDTFNHYTKMDTLEETINLRIHILSIGIIESEWKPIISKKNANGSRDYGYLQLNSYNLKNDLFLWKFSPKTSDGFNYDNTDKLECYLIMCIKLYKSLYSKYNNDACYCYNGGETRYLANNIPSSTILYQRKMSIAVDDIISCLENKREEHRRELALQYIKRIVMRNGCDIQHSCIINTSSTVIDVTPLLFENNNKEYAFDKKRFWITQLIISKVKLQLNTNYVYVGEYIKNTGDKAPVFLHRLTGKIIYC